MTTYTLEKKTTQATPHCKDMVTKAGRHKNQTHTHTHTHKNDSGLCLGCCCCQPEYGQRCGGYFRIGLPCALAGAPFQRMGPSGLGRCIVCRPVDLCAHQAKRVSLLLHSAVALAAGH